MPQRGKRCPAPWNPGAPKRRSGRSGVDAGNAALPGPNGRPGSALLRARNRGGGFGRRRRGAGGGAAGGRGRRLGRRRGGGGRRRGVRGGGGRRRPLVPPARGG